MKINGKNETRLRDDELLYPHYVFHVKLEKASLVCSKGENKTTTKPQTCRIITGLYAKLSIKYY